MRPLPRLFQRVFDVLQSFTPRVEMASIDEAYLDVTGTERLHGPPLRAAHRLHKRMAEATGLNCSIGISRSRMVAKVASDQAKPNGVLWILPGTEAAFLGAARRPQDSRGRQSDGETAARMRHAQGAATWPRWMKSSSAHDSGNGGWRSRGKRADWMRAAGSTARWATEREAEIDQPRTHLQRGHRRCGTAGSHAGAAFRNGGPQAARAWALRAHGATEAALLGLHHAHAGRSLDHATQIDTEIFAAARALFGKTWKRGGAVRLLGVQTSSFEAHEGQTNLLGEDRTDRWRKALTAMDRLRDKYGDASVTLAAGMTARFQERVQENPADLPGKEPEKK